MLRSFLISLLHLCDWFVICLPLLRPCATIIEARAESDPQCFEHMAERLGFMYHSACGSNVNDTIDVICDDNHEVDIRRVLRITRSALRERRHKVVKHKNVTNMWRASSCVRDAFEYMRSHHKALQMPFKTG